MASPVRHSLLLRLGLVMALIVALGFTGMLGSIFIAETLKGEAAAVNQAGTLRMQSYRIASSLVHRSSVETPGETVVSGIRSGGSSFTPASA